MKKFLRKIFAVITIALITLSTVSVYSLDNRTNNKNAVYIEMKTAIIMDKIYYLVETEEHLRSISTQKDALDKNYMLNADIQMSNEEWIPIGSSWDRPFTGNFYGNGFEISGLTMKDPTARLVGFFGYAEDASLHNIVLKDLDFKTASSEASSWKSVGTIVVFAMGCSTSGNKFESVK